MAGELRLVWDGESGMGCCGAGLVLWSYGRRVGGGVRFGAFTTKKERYDGNDYIAW
jgi:hypothetical protein